ncbi:MAG: RIP metalloprotease, partial [Parachlamydiales bacterium]
ERSGQKALLDRELLKQQRLILKNTKALPEEKAEKLKLLESQKNEVRLGLALEEGKVNYNPSPLQLFFGVLKDMYQTFSALFSGKVHPKWMMGPVGIVQVMQSSWQLGFFEALYWLGFISLNLGIINLFPLPVLDGGHILLAAAEAASGKRLKVKMMEKLIIPFFILLILFFLYLTYNDLLRLLKNFF